MSAQNLQDIADVRALIQLYVEGSNGDGDKMRQAFHPDAHMFGHIGAMDTYEPITDFTKLFWANRGNHNENGNQWFQDSSTLWMRPPSRRNFSSIFS